MVYGDDNEQRSKQMTSKRKVPDGYRLQGGAAIPTRPKSLAEVQQSVAECKRQRDPSDESFARLTLRHGWITQKARNWLVKEYPSE